MTRNWYAVYTLPQREKKVASLLTKKGIKTYYPVNEIVSLDRSRRTCNEALFNSFVFVYITEAEMAAVKAVPGTVNFLHWLSKPAVINWEEIAAVKQLTSAYHNIKLERCAVNCNDAVRIIDEPLISFNETSASVKFQTLKIVLPSLGYTMVAEREKGNKEKMQKELVRSGFFPKRLNSFFSN